MENKEVNILISGASIAGLNTAYWLVKYGFKVTIVERASYIRTGGQALDVRGPALEVAARMAILDELRKNSTKLKGMSVVNAATGEETYRSTDRTMTGGKFTSPDVEILRDDLCRVLLKAVGSQVEYVFDDTIISLVQDESGVFVTFSKSNPQRFDFVIGADGLRSNVRRLVFGADEQFVIYLGYYVGVFSMPNFLNLDHWEMFFQHEGTPIAACVALDIESEARMYVGFQSDNPIEYNYRDISSQKFLISKRLANIGGDIPKILEYMQQSTNFYFDSNNQVLMDNWSKERIALVGDAAYSVSPATGQGTTIAMVGAYVLAGELASHRHDLRAGFNSYENELREYIFKNQELVDTMVTAPPLSLGEQPEEESITHPDGIPDYGVMTIPFMLKNYL